jgi:ABC-type multidrug transport system ATPase subunit
LGDVQTIAPKSAAERDDRTVLAGAQTPQERLFLDKAFALSGQMLIGRDTDRAQICLHHPHVSRVHARIVLRGKTATVVDLNSANGTFVNGRRVIADTTLRPGDRIDIGPYRLAFDGTTLVSSSRDNNVELVCRHLKRVVRDRASRQPLTLLDDITLVIRPKEFVCILGSSGSGKSTLLSALSARVRADAGQVTINGEDFYTAFDALKQDVAVVPQRESLHDLLSVQAALDYTAQLRLPPDTSNAERLQAIEEVLKTVGLHDRRATKIEHLSGGQQKRASLANEIVSSPSLLFLDEVTSGLDEQTDGEMMRLFRQVADSGKTVVCITHTLANVERNCHLVVILAIGGKLAFTGTPDEARGYFQVERLGDVYERLSEKSPDEWKQAFLRHALHNKYIDGRLPIESDREPVAVPVYTPTPRERLRVVWHQTRVLTKRYLSVQFADLRFPAMMLGQCVLLAFLFVVFFGDINRFDSGTVAGLGEKARSSSQLLFLLAISCLWLGCNNAAKEIVKERPIYTRERDINLLVPSYYASKVILLGAVSLVQASLLLIVVKACCSLPGSAVAEWIFLMALSLAGVTLGLLISSFAKTNDVAVSIIPAVLIPQIIFAGVIAPVEGFARILARLFITGYWGYQGLAALLPSELLKQLPTDGYSAFGAFSVVILHVVIFAGGAIGVLYLRDTTTWLSRDAMLKKLRVRG